LGGVNLTKRYSVTLFVIFLLLILTQISHGCYQNKITIARPLEGYVYIMDKKIIPTFSGKTIIIGKITIFVIIEEEIERVEFKIDGITLHKDYLPPFFFTWNTLKYARGTHTIKVLAYDMEKNAFYDEMNVNVISFKRKE